MGFTSYDDLISEITAGKRLQAFYTKLATTNPIAANWYHIWTVGGLPLAGALYTGTALQFQRTNDQTAGALYHGGNKTPDTKHCIYINGLSSAGATPPLLVLVDMVGYYPITPSGALQTMDNSAGPDRYVSAGQCGLQAVLVGAAPTGATAHNIGTLNYVDQDGLAGVMPTTPAVACTVSVAVPSATLGSRVLTTVGGPFIPLAAGDGGMRSITNITFSAANTGLDAILMVKPLVTLPLTTALIPTERDLIMQLGNLEQIYDGACLCFLAFFPVATGTTFQGQLDVAWG